MASRISRRECVRGLPSASGVGKYDRKRAHSASERSVGYGFLIRESVRNHPNPHPYQTGSKTRPGIKVLGRCSVATWADVRNPRAMVASCSFAESKAPSYSPLRPVPLSVRIHIARLPQRCFRRVGPIAQGVGLWYAGVCERRAYNYGVRRDVPPAARAALFILACFLVGELLRAGELRPLPGAHESPAVGVSEKAGRAYHVNVLAPLTALHLRRA